MRSSGGGGKAAAHRVDAGAAGIHERPHGGPHLLDETAHAGLDREARQVLRDLELLVVQQDCLAGGAAAAARAGHRAAAPHAVEDVPAPPPGPAL